MVALMSYIAYCVKEPRRLYFRAVRFDGQCQAMGAKIHSEYSPTARFTFARVACCFHLGVSAWPWISVARGNSVCRKKIRKLCADETTDFIHHTPPEISLNHFACM